MIAVRLAVLAIAFGVEVRGIDDAVETPLLGAELRRFAPGSVAARQERGLYGGHARAVLGLDRDDAAGGVAVERCERSAQHLDAARRAEREGRRLPLAVGHGGGDAVGDEPDAAHAESRARAEAARGDLQVLGVV